MLHGARMTQACPVLQTASDWGVVPTLGAGAWAPVSPRSPEAGENSLCPPGILGWAWGSSFFLLLTRMLTPGEHTVTDGTLLEKWPN